MTSIHSVHPPRRRTPRNTLNRGLILDAALRLLDGKGAEDFTMRALARELGVGAMALYTYFRGKDEIFDAVRDRLLHRYQPPRGGGSPREQLRETCLAFYRLLVDHPCVPQLLADRPIHGDEATSAVDHMLSLLRRSGLGRTEAARAHTALMQYTLGVALWTARRRSAGPHGEAAGHGGAGGAAPDRGPGSEGDLRARFAGRSADRYPCLVDLAPELAAAQDGLPQFEFGLDGLLDGILGRP